VRHGTSSLYAALDLTTGKVIGALHSRHRASEFLAFLKTIETQVPADLDVHLVLDNASTHKTPAVKRWLGAHPRFVVHFTPTSSSWLNLVERWFAELTNKKLRRGTHTSVRQLNTDIRAWIESWNDNPRPYVWTKTADQRLRGGYSDQASHVMEPARNLPQPRLRLVRERRSYDVVFVSQGSRTSRTPQRTSARTLLERGVEETH
jgi:transposase